MEQVIYDLRHTLFDNAEISGEEVKTKKILIDFIKKHTKNLEVVDCGEFFYVKHIEENATKPSIALRADYDALATPCGKAKHMCGHDGHSAQMCYVALMLDEAVLDRNVFLIFQPEEETGAGAKKCCKIFDLEKIDYVYGMHNLPGFKEGMVYSIHDTFALASRGVTISLIGKPTHAAYPELGINPSNAIGKLLCELDELSDSRQFEKMTLCTVIGVEMGEKAFGAAAEKADLWLTMRGELDSDLMKLYDSIIKRAKELAKEYNLEFKVDVQDEFPAVINTNECVDTLLDLEQGEFLEVPMRWSEDFGHYLHYAKGCFFGVGAGVNHPGLHTETYEYNDKIMERTAQVFMDIVRKM